VGDNQSSYRQVLKASGIVGGAQVVQILIKIVGTKFIALFLGPLGMGVIGLLSSTLSVVSGITGMGIGSSAVRDIALAVNKGEEEKISHTITALRRWVWVTGLLGTFIVWAFASPLSQWTFGDTSKSNLFRGVSVIVLLGQLSAGQTALLQGYRRLKEMALAAVLGAAFGVIIDLPLYYFLGEKGILFALLFSAITGLVFSWYFSQKISFTPITQTWKQSWDIGLPMIQLGIMTVLSGMVLTFSLLQVRILVGAQMGMEAVGQFQAGWGVSTVYLQLIFQAMSRDYYPRLSGVSNDPVKMTQLVNEQLHLAILMATPMLAFAIVLAPWIIPILYSAKFVDAIPQFQWLAFGTLFKVIVWPVAFMLLATRSSKTFLFTEIVGAVGIWLISYVTLPVFGLDGIGIAYTCNYIIYLSVVWLLVRRMFNFRFDAYTLKMAGVSLVGLLAVFLLVYAAPPRFWYPFLALIITLGISIFYLWELNKLTHIFDKWKKK
jgi:O-antigen/teichoic acid export membrane protein